MKGGILSNVFTVKEAENRGVLIPINTPGIERLFKVGAKVKFRSDLKIGRTYGHITYFAGMTIKNLRRKATIIAISNSFQCKEFPGYWYSKEMLEGIYLN